MKYIKGFFLFWYDFLIGDAWEVAVGVVAGLFVLYLLAHYTSASVGQVLVLLLPLLVVLLLGYSLWRVRKTG